MAASFVQAIRDLWVDSIGGFSLIYSGEIMKNKYIAAALGFWAGIFGLHHWYLGNTVRGILYLLFFWTMIPWIISLIESVMFLAMSDNEFNAQYNHGLVQNSAATLAPHGAIFSLKNRTSAGSSRINTAELAKLYELKKTGALTEAEYEAEKKRIIA